MVISPTDGSSRHTQRLVVACIIAFDELGFARLGPHCETAEEVLEVLGKKNLIDAGPLRRNFLLVSRRKTSFDDG